MALDLVLAVVGSLLAYGVLVELGDVAPMRALGVYTLYAAACTLLLAAARAVTRRLPTVHQEVRAGEQAWVVRSWRGEWWHAHALDLGLVVLAGWLAVLGLRAGGDWVVPSLVVASAGAWFLVRVALALMGRRSQETLWLTDRHVVHESRWGSVSSARGSVVRVSPRGRAVSLVLDAPAQLRACPRPWRSGTRRPAADGIRFDCADTGHRAEDLARWIELELR